MQIDIITLFPEYFEFPLKIGPIRKAIEASSLIVSVHDLRKFAPSPKEVDDYPYGGGAGMILRVEPIKKAIDTLKTEDSKVILLSPQGELLNHQMVKRLSKLSHLIIICGRYKGVDARVLNWVDLEISIGDYVLSGGEPAALVLIDSISRWLEGAMTHEESRETDSFETGLLDCPYYTRPRVFEGLEVPEVLLSGDHEKIKRWRRKMSLKITLLRRPDLLGKAHLTDEDRILLEEIKRELKPPV